MKQLFILMLFVLAGCGDWPGGMSPSYPAEDNDPRLLAHAKRARPLISAINKYKEVHGKPPEKYDQIRVYLPATNSSSLWNGWRYHHNETNYSLTRSLGWDPFLIYSSENNNWSFNPGDGSPSKIIKLNITSGD